MHPTTVEKQEKIDIKNIFYIELIIKKQFVFLPT